MLIHALTIFISAFLLFLVQPIIAKQILPWFGGSAAVWTTCLVFFQCVLFAGYAYADCVIRRVSAKRQAVLHVILLAISLVSLPIIAGAGWKPAGDDDPSWRILGLLTLTIGMPYFLLSTTGPLVQAWFARGGYPSKTVYRLYALSNLASLLALIAYPFLIEPWVTTVIQAWVWSGAYVVFTLSCATSALTSLRQSAKPVTVTAAAGEVLHDLATDAWNETAAPKTPVPSLRQHLTWLMFAAMGSFMLLAVTNHVTHDLASVPFLWIVPLSLYLVTFILCFEGRNWYKRIIFIPALFIMVVAVAWTMVESELKLGIPISMAALFVMCMFFHGELAARKPAPEHLTRFYLMMSLGGALGGLTVGLLAVKLFNANYEFGLGLVLTLIIAFFVVRRMRVIVPIVALVAIGFAGFYLYKHDERMSGDTIVMKRNFYGSLSVREQNKDDPEKAMRRLIHGVIIHGEQYLSPERQDEPTSYYRPKSGVGLAMSLLNQPNRRIGVIGLGTGTLAVYGKQGDVMRFYDINPDVVEVAKDQFTYLNRSKAKIEHVLGDARLQLEREEPQKYDLLVIDAFSSDSIPVHLATSEAMLVYLKHIKPDGIIAFHISNKFLKLAPVLKRSTDFIGVDGILITEPENDRYSTEWFLVTANPDLRKHPAVSPQVTEIEEIPGLKLWTDDFNNLFQILK